MIIGFSREQCPGRARAGSGQVPDRVSGHVRAGSGQGPGRVPDRVRDLELFFFCVCVFSALLHHFLLFCIIFGSGGSVAGVSEAFRGLVVGLGILRDSTKDPKGF